MIPTHNSATYNKFFEEQKQKFLCLGCNVHILPTGTEHDKHMAWTLGLYHIGMLALGSTVAQSGRQNHQAFAGTTQRAINIPLEATLSSNPQLYADIQMFNPYTTQVIDAFRCVLNRYQQAIVSGNRGEFAQLMQQAKEFFMALTPEQDYSTTVRRKFQQAADVR